MNKLTDIQKEMLEVLDDTINFYGKDPKGRRAENENGCYFLTSEGQKCAVGRYMTKKDLEKIDNQGMMDYGFTKLVQEQINSKILKRLPESFWSELQYLHDYEYFWNLKYNSGLTYRGKRREQKIKNQILNGIFK